jgi:uncharacterized repeat protein (TIGR01451 family)
VTITNPSLRQQLKILFPSAFNQANEMDTTNAQLINARSVSLYDLTGGTPDWYGVQFMDSLDSMTVSGSYSVPNYCPPSLSTMLIQNPRASTIGPFTGNFTYLSIGGTAWNYTTTAITGIPDAVENLEITWQANLTSISNLPQNLRFLNLQDGLITSIPNLPPLVDSLLMRNTKITSIPFIPSTMRYMEVDISTLTSVGALPGSLRWLSLYGNLNISTYPDLPEGLETLYCYGYSFIKPLPSTLKYLYAGSSNSVNGPLTTVPPLPAGLLLLDIQGNSVTSLSPLPADILYVNARGNQLTSIPVNGTLQHIISLNCSNNQLTSLPPINSAELKTINCSNNHISSLGDLVSSVMTSVNCSLNWITSVGHISGSPTNFSFDCHNNNIENLDGLDYATSLICYDNTLTHLPYLPMLQTLQCQHNPYLQCLPYIPANTQLSAGPAIKCVNWEPGIVYKFYPVMNSNSYTTYNAGTSLTSSFPNCDAVRNVNNCRPLPLINGYVFSDLNSNGVHDAGEPYRAHQKIVLNNDINRFSFTNDEGYYELFADTIGTQTVSTTAPNYFTAVPLSYSFELYSFDTTVTGDFAMKPLGNYTSVEASLTPFTSVARRGWHLPYKIEIYNSGTTSIAPVVNLGYMPSMLIYDSSSIAGVTNSGNALQVNSTTLLPGEKFTFNAYFSVQQTALINAFVNTYLTATAGSVVAHDTSTIAVRASFDPNDKQATDSMTVDRVVARDYINYVIRFQNTGNDTAFRVVIGDTLSAYPLTANLVFVSSSHDCKMTAKGKYLTFEFPNIILPDSNVNEAKSHGFVRFKTKIPVYTPAGTNIPNKALIYFDYNAAVITNTAITRIVNPSGPVPLALLDFTVNRMSSSRAQASWSTAEENNVDGYTLEMSEDGRNYQPLQFTKAKNQDHNDYREQFNIPSAEVLYFRLKMTDKDGTITYSNVVILRGEKSSGFVVLNNPVKGDIRVSVLDDKLIGSAFKLINSQGIVVYKGRISGSSVSISTASYPAGVYILNTEMGNQKIVIAIN